MSNTTILPRPGLFLGGLRGDLHPLRMAGLISKLLGTFQVQCPRQNVHIVFKKTYCYALVDLADEDSQKLLLSQLSDTANILNVFDLQTITDNPHNFSVAPKRRDKAIRSKRSKSRGRKKDHNKDHSGRYADNSGASVELENLGTSALFEANQGWLPTLRQLRSGVGAESSSSTTRVHARNTQVDYVENNDSKPQEVNSKMNTAHGMKSNQSNSSLKASSSASTSDASASQSNSQNSLPRVRSLTKTTSSTGFELRAASSMSHPPSFSANTSGMILSSAQGNMMVSADNLRPTSVSAHALPKHFHKSAATSTTGLPAQTQVSAQTSTPGTAAGLAMGFYRYGEVVGRESRHSEFKAGGITQKDRGWLQDTVGKYVCGFLNSAEGGTLFIGVNDSGKVIGFPCTQTREDDYRLLIDEALKAIEPAIFPDRYKVRFVPVMEDSGQLSDILQVLEVQVFPTASLKHLYDFRGHAYIRRDGSLQGPLKARQVQEWTRKQLEKEHIDSWHLKSQLHEMSQLLEKERQRNREMQQKLEDLEDHNLNNEVPLERKRSKVCSIM